MRLRPVPFLLALLAALLLGASAASAQEAGGGDATEPLAVSLTSSRAVCTANTLTELTWSITGGIKPYRLTVAGEAVDPDAASATVTCGALPEGATEAPGTITATVTDATGAPATARAAYTIVPPLPAPVATAGAPTVRRFFVVIQWWGLTVPATCDVPTGCFAFRTRLAGETSWEYNWDEHRNAHRDPPPGIYRFVDAAGTTVEAGIAAMRDPIEIETPDALNWAATVQATSLTAISGLTATATHDTVIVRWNRQPSANFWYVNVRGSEVRGGQSKSIADWEAAWGDPTSATHEVTFTDLPPDTEYKVVVDGPEDLEAGPAAPPLRATTTVRTAVAPADHTPLVRGPQNLRATATHDTITVQWDHPRPDVKEEYRLYIESPYGGRFSHFPVWPPNSQYTFDDLLPNTTYLIRVIHDDITRTSAEITLTTKAAVPLRLTLTAGRAECTAGTLNPVSWEIRGGVEPYRLTVDGASVDADAASATVTCGALPEGATEAPGTITGTVTDATAAPATASAAYTIVPPLTAPANFQVGPHPGFVLSSWDRVRGAGSQFPEFDASQLSPAERRKRNLAGYVVRYRTDEASAWTYAEHSDGEYTTQYGYVRPWDTPPPGTFYTASVAAGRHPLELETPEALNWSAPIRYTTSGPAQNLTVRATHNTVTVSWSKQPGTGHASAHLWNPRGGGELRILTEGDEPGTHMVTFNYLEPNSEYKIWIFQLLGDGRAAVSRSFRTAAAPPDWQPLPRGPQNLQATATHDTITVTWDPPFEGASPEWSAAMLDGEILVHIFKTNDGTTTWVSAGEVDSIGRYRIRPNTTYTIIVRHKGVRRVEQTITVTTQAAPPLQSTGPAITCTEITPGWRICWTPDVTAG